MKRIFTLALALLFVAGTAYAVDIETSGKFYVRGSYISNDSGLQGGDSDAVSYGYYDSELDMDVDLIVSEATKIKTNFEIHDRNWLSAPNSDVPGELEFDETTGAATGFDGGDLDDNIEIKRAFGAHTFATGTSLDLGLMTGGTFGTAFADNGGGKWRIKVVHPVANGSVGAIIQKDAELGQTNTALEDSEKDDGDTYYLYGVFAVGDQQIMPLVFYSNNSSAVPDQDDDGQKTMGVVLAAQGAMGNLGYEAEVNYKDVATDVDGAEDYSLYGAYGDINMQLGSTKIGGLIAYGSHDDDSGMGFGFGEDFAPTAFGADWASVGDTSLSEYNAVTLAQLYGEFALSEALSMFAKGAYWMSNSKDDAWEDATGYELDLGGAYKLTDNVSYDVLAAYGQFELDADSGGNDDTDGFYRLYHKFTITF